MDDEVVLDSAWASPRVVALSLGAEDYTLDLEVEPSRHGRELFYRQHLAHYV